MTRTRPLPLLAVLALALPACGGLDPSAGGDPTGLVELDGVALPVVVTSCALRDGAFRRELTAGADEQTLTAVGTTPEGGTVTVEVGRTVEATAGGTTEVQTTEITVTPPDDTVPLSVVLYRLRDPELGWSELDADAPTPQVPADGPLLELDGRRLVAEGRWQDPRAGGAWAAARLAATCPPEVSSDPAGPVT
ncbi:MAG: hypothetical protein ACLGIR_00655 [Actinomycetes bacterium]